MTERVRLSVTDGLAVITNDNPGKHNAFDDEMDLRLFEILAELRTRRDVGCVVWRGEGPSWSSGRDTALLASPAAAPELTHHQLMQRGHRGILALFDLDVPVIVAMHGWAVGGSFQRALLCDIRVAAEGARFRLPEVGHGVIPDTGGVARLFQMCGHGLVSDLVLTGRVLEAEEALAHGIVSRVVPAAELDETVLGMARAVCAAPAATVKMARRIIGALGEPQVRASMAEELIGQTWVRRSDDHAELAAARAEQRSPRWTGS